jgi:hypothetical protein
MDILEARLNDRQFLAHLIHTGLSIDYNSRIILALICTHPSGFQSVTMSAATDLQLFML